MITKNNANRGTVGGASGFSLLQTSIILMVAALVMVSLVPGQGAGDSNQKTLETMRKLNRIEEAMERFMAVNGRRPCPADGLYDVNNINFGWEAGFTAANSPASGCTGGTPAAPLGPDAGTGLIVGGMVPTKSLGLPDDDAYDAWGRRISYEVDIRATNTNSCFAFKPGQVGDLQIQTKSPTGAVVFTDNVMYALLSHGPSGYGAWPSQGSSVAGRLNTGSSDPDAQNNAGVNAAFLYNTTNFTNKLITKARTLQFSDIVYYLDAYKNTCCIGQSCNNSPGFPMQGTNAGDKAGTVITTLDLNGDGLTDIAICAPNASNNGAGSGSVYVVFGSKTTFYQSALALNTLNGANGVRIDGANAGDHLCSSLASGDVNGDGINDLLIGTSSFSANKGAVYVVPGGTGAWPASFSVGGLVGSGGVRNGAGNTIGWRIDGVAAGDKFGAAVASRDFNGDGVDDILIGAPGVSANDGAAYLMCGGSGAWAATEPASALAGIPNAIPTCGFKITGPAGGHEKFGSAVTMGNIYGDNYAHAIIGAPNAAIGLNPGAGKVYDICGSNGAYSTPFDPTALNGIPGPVATCGTIFLGVGANYHSGAALDVGDISGDGVTDIIIGTPNAAALGRANGGSTYIMYGSISGFPSRVSLNGISIANNGFRVDGIAGDLSGSSVRGVCDVNGDGIPDVIIGAPGASPLTRAGAGSAYVIFGAAQTTTLVDVANLNGANGFAIYGATAGDAAGTAVSSGDFYNFGLCGAIVASPNAAVGANANAGQVYDVLGGYHWTPTFDLGAFR